MPAATRERQREIRSSKGEPWAVKGHGVVVERIISPYLRGAKSVLASGAEVERDRSARRVFIAARTADPPRKGSRDSRGGIATADKRDTRPARATGNIDEKMRRGQLLQVRYNQLRHYSTGELPSGRLLISAAMAPSFWLLWPPSPPQAPASVLVAFCCFSSVCSRAPPWHVVVLKKF